MAVAVVALVLSLAVFQLNRSRTRVTVERATMELQALASRAQSLAAVAGSRVGTARTVLGAGCTPDPNPQLWVRVRAGNVVEFPNAITYDPGTDLLTVTCDTWDRGARTNGAGNLAIPPAPAAFAFSPSGRLLNQTVPGGEVFVRVAAAGDVMTYGFRILRSGVMCKSSDPADGVCDEDT